MTCGIMNIRITYKKGRDNRNENNITGLSR